MIFDRGFNVKGYICQMKASVHWYKYSTLNLSWVCIETFCKQAWPLPRLSDSSGLTTDTRQERRGDFRTQNVVRSRKYHCVQRTRSFTEHYCEHNISGGNIPWKGILWVCFYQEKENVFENCLSVCVHCTSSERTRSKHRYTHFKIHCTQQKTKIFGKFLKANI